MGIDASKQRSIRELAFSRYKRNLPYSWPLSLSFGLIAVPSLLLGAFFPTTLLFVVPFIVMPMFFSLTVSLCDGHKGGDISSKKSFGYFFSYFRAPFHGSYCFWCNAIISFFLAFLLELVLFYALNPLFSSMYSTFASDLEEVLNQIFQYKQYESAYRLIQTNEPISLFFDVISLLGSASFALILIYRIASYAINPFLRAHLAGSSQRLLNEIYLGGLRKARPQYGRDYRSSLAPLFALFLIFFFAALALGWFFLRPYLSAAGLVSFALSVSIFVSLPFLSYYVYVLDFLFRKYSFSFISYSIGMMEGYCRKFLSRLSEEEKKEIEKEIDESKKQMDDLLKQGEKLEDNDDPNYIYQDEDDDEDE